MSSEVNQWTVVPSLRTLGGLERWFYFMDRNRPNHFSIAASLTGTVTPVEVIAGLAQLQVRHPLLTASIKEHNLSDTSFVQSSCASIPLRIVHRETDEQWHSELAHEAAIPFDTEMPPLLRTVLIHRARKSELILTIHHSVTDGMGLFFVLRDLLAALSGKTLTPLPLVPSIEETRADMLIRDSVPSGLPPSADTTPYRSQDALPVLQSMVLTKEETGAVLDLVRQRGVTLHSALTAALVLAGRLESVGWRRTSVRVFTPINIRNTHGVGESATVALGAGLVRIPPSDSSELWGIAHRAMNDLAYFRRPENDFAISTVMGHATAEPARTHELSSSMGYDIILTNPGLINLTLESERFRVTGLWGPSVLIGFEGEQSVSALTWNGRLFLTHISTSPVFSLLKGAVSLLLAETKASSSVPRIKELSAS